jgi:predicted aspartyl protease
MLSALAGAPLSGQPAEQPQQPRLTVGANTPASDAEPSDERLRFEDDATQRMLLPVSVSGSGPFRFLVDTGAERTSISRELADTLQLPLHGTMRIHSMSEISSVDSFLLSSLQFGAREMTGVRAPAFSRSNIGADGVLGADALQSQRVLFDFGRNELSIAPSARAQEDWPASTVVVIGRRRHGRLVLVDAMVEGQRVWVIIDTGSEVTVANSRLERLLMGRRRTRAVQPVLLRSVTGGTLAARYTLAREVQIGDVRLRELPIAFADAEPFRQLNLQSRPAILLGMDALRLFERVSVDFGNRRVRLLLRPEHRQRDQPIWRRVS